MYWITPSGQRVSSFFGSQAKRAGPLPLPLPDEGAEEAVLEGVAPGFGHLGAIQEDGEGVSLAGGGFGVPGQGRNTVQGAGLGRTIPRPRLAVRRCRSDPSVSPETARVVLQTAPRGWEFIALRNRTSSLADTRLPEERPEPSRSSNAEGSSPSPARNDREADRAVPAPASGLSYASVLKICSA